MLPSRFLRCVLQVALLASVAHLTLAQTVGACKRGRATYYTVDSIGACGFGDNADIYTFAPNEAFFNGSARCGECFEVTGYLGTRVMMVSNACPVSGNEQWCSGDYDHFDIDSRAFTSIGKATDGVMYTSIKPVVCPSAGGVAIIIGTGYNGFYLPVFFFNHKVPIDRVAMTMPNMAKTSILRTDYNAWLSPQDQQIEYPVTYEVTSVYGESITVTIPTAPTAARQRFNNAAQFTQWTVASPTPTCPTVHDFNIFMNGFNPDTYTNHMVAQNWRSFISTTNGDANPDYTADLPHNATKAIQSSLSQWQEWGFGTVIPIPGALIAGVELQLKSSIALTELRISWVDNANYAPYRVAVAANTWTYYHIPKAAFVISPGDSITALDKLAVQPNAATTITIANFRVIPMPDVVVNPPPTSPAQSPQNSPTQSPQNSPTQSPQNSPTQSPQNSPASGPSAQSPTGSASTLSFGIALFVISFIALFL